MAPWLVSLPVATGAERFAALMVGDSGPTVPPEDIQVLADMMDGSEHHNISFDDLLRKLSAAGP